jgi:hypothetical protein
MISLKKNIIRRINHDLNKFTYEKEKFDKIEEIMKTNKKYSLSVLRVTIKDGKAIGNSFDGDSRKKVILQLINDSLDFAKKINKIIPDVTFYIYASDVHSYEYQNLPFWVISKPENDNGILFPDNTFKCHPINNVCHTWDDAKKVIYEKCDNVTKITKMYFKGANTGADKHNLRIQLMDEEKRANIPIQIILSRPNDPMYSFCKYKYLLNLPGHQPWSYRFKYLFLMKSLVIDVVVRQHYGKDENKRWMNFYDSCFVPWQDYVQINYHWHEGKDNSAEFKKLLNRLKTIFDFFEKNPDKYNEIVKNGYDKAKKITQEVVHMSIYLLIRKYHKKVLQFK